ncbi:MAG: hypothetical protein JW910_03595, partial [Anaerolineae bacterium]|nr:hypothetical protein [Anaerolineae bacterium]
MLSDYTRLFRPWTLVLIANLLYLAIIFATNSGDPKVFVTLGECFSQCRAQDGSACDEGTEGYDGQFAYYIARDPLDTPDCLDVPAYRMQRILLPALGRLLSLGQTALIPWAFVVINLAALVGGTVLLESLLIEGRASRWFALSYGLFVGVFMAVRLSTTESLAYGLVIGGIWLIHKNRLGTGSILLALAVLAKETTALFVIGYVLYFALNRRWSDAIRLGIITAIPFLAWQIV